MRSACVLSLMVTLDYSQIFLPYRPQPKPVQCSTARVTIFPFFLRFELGRLCAYRAERTRRTLLRRTKPRTSFRHKPKLVESVAMLPIRDPFLFPPAAFYLHEDG